MTFENLNATTKDVSTANSNASCGNYKADPADCGNYKVDSSAYCGNY